MTRRSEPVEIKLPDGNVLRGVYNFTEPGSREHPAVVFAHGLGSTRSGEKADALEAECCRRDWVFAAFDFRGHGRSDGAMVDVSATRLIEDLEAITHTVVARAAGPLFLFGSSMGAWVSGWFAARKPGLVTACAFVAPAFHLLEWRKLSSAERNDWARSGRFRIHDEHIDMELGSGLLLERALYPLEELVTCFCSPSLIFHGMQDDLVPYAESIDFATRCASSNLELRLFKDGDHRLNLHKAEMARAACDFFAGLALRERFAPPQ